MRASLTADLAAALGAALASAGRDAAMDLAAAVTAGPGFTVPDFVAGALGTAALGLAAFGTDLELDADLLGPGAPRGALVARALEAERAPALRAVGAVLRVVTRV